MTDHITTTTDGVAALDYEMAKDVFHEKLTNDLHGRGRMESAFYHTAQWIFLQGCAERDALLARIAELEQTVALLRDGDTCARLCEGAAYRFEANRLERMMDHPNDVMLMRGVEFALHAKLGGGYGWKQYVRDLWTTMSGTRNA